MSTPIFQVLYDAQTVLLIKNAIRALCNTPFTNTDREAIWKLATDRMRDGAHPVWSVVDAAVARDFLNQVTTAPDQGAAPK